MIIIGHYPAVQEKSTQESDHLFNSLIHSLGLTEIIEKSKKIETLTCDLAFLIEMHPTSDFREFLSLFFLHKNEKVHLHFYEYTLTLTFENESKNIYQFWNDGEFISLNDTIRDKEYVWTQIKNK